MPYSTLAEVKEILRTTGTAKDAEIANCIADADKWVDNELGEFASVPVSPVPPQINVASKYKAAALFRERGETEQEVTEWSRFDNRAENALNGYIKKTYFKGGIK